MKGQKNIKSVFLKSSTDRYWLNSLQPKVNTFSLMYFYTKCRSNKQRILTPLQWKGFYQACNNTLLTVKKGIYTTTVAFFLKSRR